MVLRRMGGLMDPIEDHYDEFVGILARIAVMLFLILSAVSILFDK